MKGSLPTGCTKTQQRRIAAQRDASLPYKEMQHQHRVQTSRPKTTRPLMRWTGRPLGWLPHENDDLQAAKEMESSNQRHRATGGRERTTV